ncbi:MAG: pantoate--beta-alanine ligase [Thermodesulfobacteriota bacterium]
MEIRDAAMLVRIENVNKPAVISVAAIVGSTRLIDNIIIGR